MSAATVPGATAPRDKREMPGGLALPIGGVVLALALIVVGILLSRRRDEALPTAYGRLRGGEAGRSVNGTVTSTWLDVAVVVDDPRLSAHAYVPSARRSIASSTVLVSIASASRSPSVRTMRSLPPRT